MTVRVTTRVLPGKRIEITAPDLAEGQTVDVLVMARPERPAGKSLVEFLESLPPGPRSAATWEEVERNFQEERNAWDR
jgi:hypothetical protein